MKIVTRGFGQSQNIVTRGYGRSILERIYREIIKLSTSFNRVTRLTTSFSYFISLITYVNEKFKLTSSIAGMIEKIRIVTSFGEKLKIPTLMEFGKLFLNNVFKVAAKIKLACGFDLRRRDE